MEEGSDPLLAVVAPIEHLANRSRSTLHSTLYISSA